MIKPCKYLYKGSWIYKITNNYLIYQKQYLKEGEEEEKESKVKVISH